MEAVRRQFGDHVFRARAPDAAGDAEERAQALGHD